MSLLANNKKTPKDLEERLVENYKPWDRSVVSPSKDGYPKIIIGTNLKPSNAHNYFQNSFRKLSISINDIQETGDIDDNIKSPIILEEHSLASGEQARVLISSPSESYQDSTPVSVSDTNIFSEDFSNFENVENIDNVDDGSILPIPEFQNLDENFEKLPQFYCLKNKVLVILKPETTFWFCGKLKVKVLFGALKIYGAVLSNSDTQKPVEVYSPKNNSLVSIETEKGPGKCDIEELWKALVAEGANRNLKQCSLVLSIEKLEPGWAVAFLENLSNYMTDFFDTYCSFKLFPRVDDQTFYSWNDPKRAEIRLQANFRYCKTGKQLTFDPKLKTKVIDKIFDEYSSKKQSINIIFGGKSVGKSTLSRYLVNSIMTKSGSVVLINLDPGQTECTPSGCISINLIDKPLLGPNFTQLRMPYYQLYIGSVNITNCVTRYLDGVKKLANLIKSDSKISSFPIIVNTMGFCKGIGWGIAVSIIQYFKPTNVIQMISMKSKNNFDDHLSQDIVNHQNISWMIWRKKGKKRIQLSYDLHRINSEAEGQKNDGETWNMEPYQQRDLVMLSYLSQITNTSENLMSWNFEKPSINEVVPYKVPLSSLFLSLTRVGVPLTHILAAMNGNIVALCGYDPCEQSEETNNSNSKNPKVLLRTPLSTCYGFGVIRGIDLEEGFIYLNTPLTLEILQCVNCLVDCVSIPSALLPLNLPNAPYTGNKADLPTSKEPRRGYSKMRNQLTNRS